MRVPRVSVCIVTYNHERYIHNCIMSVIAQAKDADLEILVGDDLSTDGTQQVVNALQRKFPEFVYYFRHNERMGPVGNFQFLISRARGEYIAHLDGDDYWLPGKLDKQVELLEGAEGFSAIYTNALCINDSGSSLGLFNNYQPTILDTRYLLLKGNFLNHSSLIYKAIHKYDILLWSSDFIDYKIHLYLSCKGDLGYINSPGVVYRVGSETSMLVHQRERVLELYWNAIDDLMLESTQSNVRLLAYADFLRRVFFLSVRTRSLTLLKKWWKTVWHGCDQNKVLLIVFATRRIIVHGVRMLMLLSCAKIGSGMRIIYWR